MSALSERDELKILALVSYVESSIVGGFRPFFLGGRKGGAHILRGRTLIRISCPDWSNCVRTPRDVHTVAA